MTTSTMKRVNVTVDGIAVQAFEGMTILAAATMAKIEIPTLCFYWGLNDSAACRVCCVEVEGENQLVAACSNPIIEGMTIRTNTPKVRAARKLNVELILSQHNVQCASCVRGSNCELQALANTLNITDVRFQKQLETTTWNKEFPLIRENDKCIKCMRCIRVCDNVQASYIWDIKNRSTRSTVGVGGNESIENTSCTLCGQCITHCPTGALRERDDVDRVLEAIADPETITLIQLAPSVRTSWGEALGLTHEHATAERLVAALKRIGFDYVFDTDFSADLTILEEASEFVQRFGEKDKHAWPMFTSCCPGWMRWVKANHPELIDNLSTAKSPQQMFGAVAKSYFPKTHDIDPARIFSVSAMPCLAKKQEAALPSMNDAGAGQDVDGVLTVREINRLLRSCFIDAAALPELDFDSPFGIGTGAGEIFGATGGVMEAALRSAYFFVTGNNPDPDAFAEVRGSKGWREARFDLAGTPIRVAIASGLANADALITAVLAGEVEYDFVEIMACPGGCIGGGGQPINKQMNIHSIRTKVLYSLDKRNTLRFSHENPAILQVYDEYFEAPLSKTSHKLLHTDHRLWKMPHEPA